MSSQNRILRGRVGTRARGTTRGAPRGRGAEQNERVEIEHDLPRGDEVHQEADGGGPQIDDEQCAAVEDGNVTYARYEAGNVTYIRHESGNIRQHIRGGALQAGRGYHAGNVTHIRHVSGNIRQHIRGGALQAGRGYRAGKNYHIEIVHGDIDQVID